LKLYIIVTFLQNNIKVNLNNKYVIIFQLEMQPYKWYIDKKIKGHDDTVVALLSLPNNHLASGSSDATIKIWNTDKEILVNTLVGHSKTVNKLLFIPRGKHSPDRLASASADDSIKIWNLSNGKLEFSFSIKFGWISPLLHFSDQNQLASFSKKREILIWSLTTGLIEKKLDGPRWPFLGCLLDMTILPNNLLASCSWYKNINIWHPSTGNLITTLKGHTDTVWSMTVLSNGQLVSASSDKTIKIWNFLYGQQTTNEDKIISSTLRGHNDWVYNLITLPDEQLASASLDKTIRIWSTNPNKLNTTFILKGHSSPVTCIVFLSGEHLISSCEDENIKVWNFKSGHLIDDIYQNQDEKVKSLIVLNNSKLKQFASASNDGTIKIWTGNQISYFHSSFSF
jgi:WD40 repeat protein